MPNYDRIRDFMNQHEVGGLVPITMLPTGSTSTQVCVGNDSRLSDARTPLSHTHPLVDITDEGALAAKNTVATADIDNDAVTYDKIQNVSLTDRFLGRKTAGAGNVEELTGTEVTARLDVFTSTLKGLAPSSGGGTINFLRADGTWVEPAGGGGGNATNSHSVGQIWRSVTMTNIGTAYKDIYSTTAFDEEHLLKIDFTGATSVRIVFLWDYVGAGTQQVRWVDLDNNANVLIESATFTADQDPGDSGWVALPAAYSNATKRIEWQGKSTTGTDDPIAKGYIIYLK